MTGTLTLDTLKAAAAAGEIDTVLVCQVDMQGRLMGKRFHVQNFLDTGHEETHSCNYLLATDLPMETVQGYKSTSWESGYGDYVMKPDLSTLRRLPWLDGTAMVLCDMLDHHSHQPVPHSPRQMLKRQIARLADMGMKPMMATELEFYLFRESFEQLFDNGYRDMTPLSMFNQDYAIHLTTREDAVMRDIRNGLFGAGIPVENSKGEAYAGQEEINIRYAAALDTADFHTIVKTACKDIAWQHGRAVTFMAKYDTEVAGSSSHVHQSLWSDDGRTPLFHDPDGRFGMSKLMEHYVAGLLKHAAANTWFLAPYANSYKRFTTGLFAPTKAIWSNDNRTAGFRLCGENSKAIRIECRIGGADLNPYLALATQLAAGIDGIEQELALEEPHSGDAYEARDVREIPGTLRDATVALDRSDMLRAAFGDDVIDHYVHAARWEQAETDRTVTDWDRLRGFDRG
ncbi:glutamine synthetase family protein [Oceanomicrobium pacificus]|uniref:Glutamine synthetase n=1 Tax=Oceanomicrobium pacificus TaxID=2692916 RepID=A0A6B0TSI0_9RHOB|nr:glutamine synthetase family protein [Oceanomicrobium pacificus]MXU64284.1 glutamine synthetase [Oceanomicrobium pacificus]